jgi:hypothetical protein
MRLVSIAIQTPPDKPEILRYLTQYFGSTGILVYWGTAQEFVIELDRRWKAAE